MTPEGLITIRSNYGPKDTVNRLETQIEAKGLNVFAHIDQEPKAEPMSSLPRDIGKGSLLIDDVHGTSALPLTAEV
jgi:hypothetical protein